MSKQSKVFPGKSYALFSATGGAVTTEDGATTLFVLAAGVQDIRPAQVAVWLVPDDTVVTELFSRALGGAGTSSGGGSGEGGLTPAETAVLYGAAQRAGDNTLSGRNTFTGAVDLSTATVTPPSDWLLVDNVYSSGMPGVLETAHIYDLGELAADTDLSAVAFTVNATKVQTCELWLSCGETAYTVTWPAGLVWLDGEPALEAGKSYRFALRCEPNGKTIANLAYEYTA